MLSLLRTPARLAIISRNSRSLSTKMTDMHPLARAGFDSSGASGLYDRARPSYPPTSIEAILSAPTPSDNKLRIAELGSGTGIATRMLLQSSADRLERLIAVEPSEGMRANWEQATRAVAQEVAPNAQVKCIDGAFEDFDAGTDNDVVVIAQAWHWCRSFEGALSQAAKALRPGGVLALLWNLEDREAASWVASIRDLYEAHEGDTPQYRHNRWHAMYKTDSIANFEALPEQHWNRVIPTTEQGVVDRVLSKSYISVLPEEERTKLASQIKELLKGGASQGVKWIDESQGIFEYPYRTDLLLFRKEEQ